MACMIVDDHGLVLSGVRALLSGMPELAPVEGFDRPRRALEALDRGRRYDLFLVDLQMPDIDGLTFCEALRARRIGAPVILMTGHPLTRMFDQLLRQPVRGLLSKQEPAQELARAIRQVLAGEVFVSDVFANAAGADGNGTVPAEGQAPGLSPRQREVLDLMADGHANKQIAQLLAISEPTVKTHIAALFRQFGVNNRTRCVREAERLGIIRPQAR